MFINNIHMILLTGAVWYAIGCEEHTSFRQTIFVNNWSTSGETHRLAVSTSDRPTAGSTSQLQAIPTFYQTSAGAEYFNKL